MNKLTMALVGVVGCAVGAIAVRCCTAGATPRKSKTVTSALHDRLRHVSDIKTEIFNAIAYDKNDESAIYLGYTVVGVHIAYCAGKQAIAIPCEVNYTAHTLIISGTNADFDTVEATIAYIESEATAHGARIKSTIYAHLRGCL